MGHLLRDSDFETIDRLIHDLDSYYAALRSDERESWLRHHFGGSPGFSTDREVTNELLALHLTNKALTVHDCEECGRLWVEEDLGANRFLAFLPDQHESRQLLATRSPVRYDPSRDEGWESAVPAEPPRDQADKIRLFELLELCLEQGLGLVDSLAVCARELSPGRVGTAVHEALEHLSTGGSLATAWSNSTELFDVDLLEQIRDAEQDGSLDTTAGQLARQLRFASLGVSACARFLEQFANTLRESAPDLSAALERLESSTADDRYSPIARDLRESGGSIGGAMAQHPALFPESVVKLVARAEIGGDLIRTLARCADALRRGLVGQPGPREPC